MPAFRPVPLGGAVGAVRVAVRRHAATRRPRWRTFSACLAAALALSLALPDTAAAIPSVDDIVNKAIDIIAKKIFGVGFDGLTGTFFAWLVNAPNFAGEANGQIDGKLESVAHISQGIAFALVGVVMTFSALQYWLTGIADLNGDGSELLRGITRGVGVALLVLAWPWFFENAVAVSNQVTAVLVNGRDLDLIAAAIFGALAVTALFTGGLALIFGIILSIVGVLILFGLIAMKIAISATLAIVYAGMPLALVLLPIEPLAWVPRLAIRTLAGLLLVPILWAVCLATFIAVGFDSLTLGGGGSFLDKLVKPLTALALLWLMFSLPRTLMRVAAIGSVIPSAGGGGRGGLMVRMGEHLMIREVGRHFSQSSSQSSSEGGGNGNGQQRGRGRSGGGDGDGSPDGGEGGGTPDGGGGGSGAWVDEAGTMHDGVNGLPTQAGDAQIGDGLANVASRRSELDGMSEDGKRQQGQEALDQLGAAGYKDQVKAYTAGHTPGQTVGRMADASTADGLSQETSDAFVTWGAMDAGTRDAVMAADDAAAMASPDADGATPPDGGAATPPPPVDGFAGDPGSAGGEVNGSATPPTVPVDGGADVNGSATPPTVPVDGGGDVNGSATPPTVPVDGGADVNGSATPAAAPVDGMPGGDTGGPGSATPPRFSEAALDHLDGHAGPPSGGEGPATPPAPDGPGDFGAGEPFAMPTAGPSGGDIPSPTDDGLDGA